MRVAVVAEFYPRAEDPVLGVWAHRQAVAARDAGVLHRPVPAKADVAGGARTAARSLAAKLRQPRRAELDGIEVEYVPYLSPPRGVSYGSWGRFAAPALRRALRRAGPFDLVHAHNAVPPGDAVRRAQPGAGAVPRGDAPGGRPAALPLVVSVHGGDVFFTAQRSPNVARTFAAAQLVLANSAGVADRVRDLGARDVRVVPLGTDVPAARARRGGPPSLVTVGHLVARKRHADVLRALRDLGGVRYEIVGDGPERPALEALARDVGVQERVCFHGQLPHDRALAVARGSDVFVMPSVDEAFGVAYVEAMAAGLPAVGAAGEPGPQEIAAAGGGLLLAPPRDPAALARVLETALRERDRLGAAARATVLDRFTWERCGRETVAAYEDALR